MHLVVAQHERHAGIARRVAMGETHAVDFAPVLVPILGDQKWIGLESQVFRAGGLKIDGFPVMADQVVGIVRALGRRRQVRPHEKGRQDDQGRVRVLVDVGGFGGVRGIRVVGLIAEVGAVGWPLQYVGLHGPEGRCDGPDRSDPEQLHPEGARHRSILLQIGD